MSSETLRLNRGWSCASLSEGCPPCWAVGCYYRSMDYLSPFLPLSPKLTLHFCFLSNINPHLSIDTLKIDFQNDDHFFQYVLNCNSK